MKANRWNRLPDSVDLNRSLDTVGGLVSVALVARRTNNRNVVGSIPTNAVCITVLTGNRLG